jgi:hypothetical protein
VPVTWPAGCAHRLLALSLPQQRGDAAAAGAGAGGGDAAAAGRLGKGEDVDPLLWSEAFRVEYPASGGTQAVVPVFRLGTPGEPLPVDATSLAAAAAEFRRLTAPRRGGASAAAREQQRREREEMLAVWGSGGGGGGGGSMRPSSSASSLAAAAAAAHAAAAAAPPGGGGAGGEEGERGPPLFVHVAKYTEGGVQEYLAVALQARRGAAQHAAVACLW